MTHLLQTLFAASLTLGLAACESEAPTQPAKTAKADAKKADTKDETDAPDGKADAAKADDTSADAPGDVQDGATPDPNPAAGEEEEAPAEGDEDLQGYDPRVSKAARVAAQISEDPQQADELLASLDLDRDTLDALMYEIANDPDLTAQYRMARGI